MEDNSVILSTKTNINPDGKPDIRPDIRIDKEGIWYYRGAEMFRKDILHMLYQNLKRDPDGRYLVEINNDVAYVDVEDTPYVVRAFSRSYSAEHNKEVLYLTMPDESIEELDPATLRIGKDNALYGKLMLSNVEVRFSRASYYQLAEHIQTDTGEDKFYICLNGNRYYIGSVNEEA